MYSKKRYIIKLYNIIFILCHTIWHEIGCCFSKSEKCQAWLCPTCWGASQPSLWNHASSPVLSRPAATPAPSWGLLATPWAASPWTCGRTRRRRWGWRGGRASGTRPCPPRPAATGSPTCPRPPGMPASTSWKKREADFEISPSI